MLPNKYCGGARITWRSIFIAIIMATLISGLTVLFYFLATAKSRQMGLEYSNAESVRLGNNGTISFPFGPIHFSCPKYKFTCSSSRSCIELKKRCDGKVDCPKAEDELNCVCAFRMPPSKFCDSYPDCFDESDESFCSYCPEGYFNCGDGKCIPRKKVCDSIVDCNNFMDENFCFRLLPDTPNSLADNTDPVDSTSTTTTSKIGFLHRNKKGIWHPVCANPIDEMQDALASLACASITANPLATSTHQYKSFTITPDSRSFIYHFRGRFIQWNGCLSQKGIFLTCDDGRCGFNPKHLLPSKRRRARIVGGNSSEPGAWPWHGAIYKNGSYACGASLISDQWLLSAAHCFIDYTYNYYEVQLGMLRMKSFTPHQKTFKIDRIVTHEKFNIITLEFDIVMLRISERVNFDFWIRPICLPDPRKVENSGSYCTTIGWGDTGESVTEDHSEDLRQVHVPLTMSCQRDPQRWLCAGYTEGGRDACQGDSGGPLMCLQDDRISWYIAGVISAGIGCARPKTPGMYTRVVFFLHWIQQVMISNHKVDQPLDTCPGWKCAAVGGGNCLNAKKVCDGHVDCYDAQDEVHCSAGKFNASLFAVSSF